jgi:hypothetical protein
MPSLTDSLRTVSDDDIDMPDQQDSSSSPFAPPPQSAEPGMSSTLCCPLPLVSAYPDNLRQFYRPGVPQTRVIPVVTKG